MRSRRFVCWLCCLGFLFVVAAKQSRAITIDTVPIGNPGNAPDDTGFGSVDYTYSIGKYEVTVGQYTAFLNAVAATDTYGLYVSNMATDVHVAGIAQSGSSGSYTYSVIGSANKPVVFVSWGDTARFVNWLNNGQPGLGGPAVPQNAASTEDGAYTLNGATTQAALNAVTRNPGATWAIPTENEWYKAAYHKNDGITGNYWNMPTSTDTLSYSDQPPGSDAPTQSNTANFYRDDLISNGYNDGLAVTGSTDFSTTQNLLTDVGAYSLSVSPYGTFDQGGNVEEWTEGLNGSLRDSRGGAWSTGINGQDFDNPAFSTDYRGFRVVEVPEPASIMLAALGFLGSIAICRKPRRAFRA